MTDTPAEAPAPDLVRRIKDGRLGMRPFPLQQIGGMTVRPIYAIHGPDLDCLVDEITRLTAEVERLVKSRNRWGQKYNKLLSAVRTENAYGVYAEARDAYREKITELAAENEKLRNDVRLAVMSDSKECSILTAEAERLRAWIQEVADDEFSDVDGIRASARAALQEPRT